MKAIIALKITNKRQLSIDSYRDVMDFSAIFAFFISGKAKRENWGEKTQILVLLLLRLLNNDIDILATTTFARSMTPAMIKVKGKKGGATECKVFFFSLFGFRMWI